MSIWFLLWLFLSATLLYFFGWTLYILYRQKKAWKAYAVAKKLRYSSARMMASPQMNGIINDYTVSFFTGEHFIAEGRATRKLTAIEVNLSSRMPFDGSIGSGGMVPLVRTLGLKEEFAPAHKDWDKAWIAATASRNALEAYLTPERMEALIALMKMKTAWIIFVFRNDTMLLRLDTPDPLQEPKKIDLLVKKMTDAAKLLELKAGEAATLKNAASQPSRTKAPTELSVESSGESGVPNLELE